MNEIPTYKNCWKIIKIWGSAEKIKEWNWKIEKYKDPPGKHGWTMTKDLWFTISKSQKETQILTQTQTQTQKFQIYNFPIKNHKHKHKFRFMIFPFQITNTNTKISDLWFSLSKSQTQTWILTQTQTTHMIENEVGRWRQMEEARRLEVQVMVGDEGLQAN